MTEPTTAAGRALLRSDFDTTAWGPSVVRAHVTRAVLAIEREAAEAAGWGFVESLRAARADADRLAEALREVADLACEDRCAPIGPPTVESHDPWHRRAEAALAAHEEATR